jgi:hypothetical protein
MRKKKATERRWDYEEKFKGERNHVTVSNI